MVSAKRRIRKAAMPLRVAIGILAAWIACVAGLFLLILYLR
jgi:hypothetical protein